ncbi:MAG: WecB/TagA/CpsF family glycosyltransferase [Phycisphaerae bacterium]
MTSESLNTSAPRSRITLMGVEIDRLTEAQCVARIMADLAQNRQPAHASDREGGGGWVVTANVDHLRRLTKQPEYRALCRPASLVTADGTPLLWAARLQRTPLPERVTGSNLIWSLTAAAARDGRSILLLGGAPGSADGASQVLQKKYPGLRVVGTACPPFGFEKDPTQMTALRELLLATLPDIVYVALGSPKQERFIAEFRQLLPGAWWLGVGISFSFVNGDVARAPKWMQHCGLEWVHRLCQEPKRLARRYLMEDLVFALGLLLRLGAARLLGSRKPAA